MLWATGCSHTYGDDLQDKSSSLENLRMLPWKENLKRNKK